jgi:tRNA dimethylallyltransferase
VDPDDAYNAARFVTDCLDAVRKIHRHGSIPLLTGGTGLYLAALKRGLFELPSIDRSVRDKLQLQLKEAGIECLYEQLYVHDPESADRVHPHDRSRIIRALEIYLSTGMTMTEYMQRQALQTSHPEFKHFLTIGLTCSRELLYKRINERSVQLIEQGLETEVRSLLAKGYSSRLQSMQSIGYRHMINYIEGIWSLEQCVELLARDTRHYAKRQFTWFNRDESIVWFNRTKPDGVIGCIDQFLKQLT